MACMSKLFGVTNGSVHNLNFNSPRRFRFRSTTKIKMSSSDADADALPPLPENRTVVGYGMTAVDFLATVDGFPNPDDKVRSTSLKVEGGGNAGNALTCAARLGLKPRLISKVADDSLGFVILKELQADAVDASQHYYLRFMEQDYFISMECFLKLLYLLHKRQSNNIPILVEAESPREGLDELLKLADFVTCSAKFPQAWTQAPSIPSTMVSMLLRLPNINFVIVTLGEDGCLMLERSVNEDADIEERDVESCLEFLSKGKDDSLAIPTCIPSAVTKFRANGIGTICGRFYIGTAEKIPDSELIDTTGAGDAFIGAIMYAICANMVPEKMLPLAAQVAAAKCRALGARTGLPRRTDPCLASFLH